MVLLKLPCKRPFSECDDGQVCAKRPRPSKPCSLNALPNDILAHIFSHVLRSSPTFPMLPRLSVVCSNWRRVVLSNPEYWSRIEHSSSTDSKYAIYTRTISTSPEEMSEECRSETSSLIKMVVARAGASLRSLDLSVCKSPISKTDLEILGEVPAARLAHLMLPPGGSFPPFIFKNFFAKCKELRTLHMPSCDIVNMDFLRLIVECCPTLEEIAFEGCEGLRGSGYVLSTILRPLRLRLRCLNLSGTSITNFPLREMSSKFPELEELHLDYCRALEVQEYQEHGQLGVEFFPNLQIFSMNVAVNFPVCWALALFRRARRLEVFSVNCAYMPCVFNKLTRIFDGPLPTLRHLGLAGQPITDSMWMRIAEVMRRSLVTCDLSKNNKLTCEIPSTGEFEKLEEMNLANTGLTDKGFKCLLRMTPKLKSLNLSGCRGISDRILRRDPLKERVPVGQNEHQSMSCTTSSPASMLVPRVAF